jgi:hypothetical protein
LVHRSLEPGQLCPQGGDLLLQAATASQLTVSPVPAPTRLRVDNIAHATPKMEFLDINLTKDSSFLRHAIHSPFYWRILKRNPYSSPVLKTLQKIGETGIG